MVEKLVGIEHYLSSDYEGIGGIYKISHKDFIVKEITSTGHVLEIREDSESPPFLKDSKDRYTTFNIVKVNQDAFQAFKELSYALKIPLENISYAGIKDKCAISVQEASIPGNHIEALKKIKLRDIYIRNIHPTRKPIKIGDHQGNNFTIVIRNIAKSDQLERNVKQLISFLGKNGFPNYYGLQRFGSLRPNSHKVGRFLLHEDYENAYKEFVTSVYKTESLSARQARENLYSNGDLEKALVEFPKSLKYERKMIKHLINNPGDYKGALRTLPLGLETLLISAFQSWFFNKMISIRVEKGDSLLEPIKGDVIGILDDVNGNLTKITYLFGNRYDNYLKQAIELNRAVIVMPLIGYNTNLDDFPAVKDLFYEVIAREGIDRRIFQEETLKSHDFKGSFRAITLKPIGLNILEITNDDMFPDKKKIRIEFSLSRGCYATMLLRELMK